MMLALRAALSLGPLLAAAWAGLVLPDATRPRQPVAERAAAGARGRAHTDDNDDDHLAMLLCSGRRGGTSPTVCGTNFTAVPYSEQGLWGSAYHGWEACGGQVQSPVDLPTACETVFPTSPPLSHSFGVGTAVRVLNTGHGLEVKGRFGTLTADNITFESEEFHLHHPSEHTVDGQHAPVEMHIVSTYGEQVAAVSIQFDVGEHNCCLEEVLARLPIAGCEHGLESLSLACFSRQLSGPYWTYRGSRTTPPCAEVVRWHVLRQRATLSQVQLERLLERYTSNARSTQPLHGREVACHEVGTGP